MAFIPIPRGIQLCFNFVTAGQAWQFCITVQKDTGTVAPADLDTVVGIGQSRWTSSLKAIHALDSQFRGCTATDQSVSGGAQSIGSLVNNGTAATGSLPMGTAVVVSHRTAKRGRSYRGRSYWAGLPTASQNSPTDITSTYAAALALAFASLAGDLSSAGFPQIVASKQHNGVVTNPAAVNPVIATIVDSHYDSQRRRLFGRGT